MHTACTALSFSCSQSLFISPSSPDLWTPASVARRQRLLTSQLLQLAEPVRPCSFLQPCAAKLQLPPELQQAAAEQQQLAELVVRTTCIPTGFFCTWSSSLAPAALVTTQPFAYRTCFLTGRPALALQAEAGAAPAGGSDPLSLNLVVSDVVPCP